MLLAAGCAPSGPKALLTGERLISVGKFPEAVDELRLAVQLIPDNAQAWNHLGLAHHAAGQPGEASRAYQQATQRNPNLTSAHFNIGVLSLEQNDLPAAVSSLTTFTVLQRDSAEGWLKLATAQLRSRQLEAAERSFQNVLRFRPALPEALNGLGLIQVQRRRLRDAVTLFSNALQRKPDYGPALLNLATVSYSYDRAGSLQRYKGWLANNRNSSLAAGVKNLADGIETDMAAQRAASNQVAAALAQLSKALEATNSPVARPTNSFTTLNSKNVIAQAPGASTNVRVKNEPAIAASPASPASALGTPPSSNQRPAPIIGDRASLQVPSAPPDGKLASPTREVVIADESLPQPAVDRNSPTKEVSKPATEEVKPTPPEVPDLTKITPPATLPLPKSGEKSGEASLEEKRTFAQRLNPANWFRAKPRPSALATPLDGSQRVSRPSAPTNSPPLVIAKNLAAAPERVEPAPSPASIDIPPARPQIPRYNYLSPASPTAGDRPRARQALERGLKAHAGRQLSASLNAYREAVQLDPGYFEAHYNVGLASYEMKDWPASLSAYETALSINPLSLGARFNLALSLERAGYPLDAVAELEKVLQDNPKEANARLSIGKLYAEQLQQPQSAARHFRQLLELEPRHPQAGAIRQWLVANASR